MGWDPRRADLLVGTSAGSITATSLRAGLPARDMLARAEGRPLSTEAQQVLRAVGPFRDPPHLTDGPRMRSPREMVGSLGSVARRPFSARPWARVAGFLPEGQMSTEMISQGIGGLFPAGWPTSPLWICAVRQDDGRRRVFGRDEAPEHRPLVADAVAASCAIPGFFAPVTIGGTAYVDGGVHSPTNADVLADEALGVTLVVVSSPMSIAGRDARRPLRGGPLRRWSRTLLDAEAARLRRAGIVVVAFQPTEADAAVMGVNAMDPSRRAAIARQAYQSTLARLERTDTRTRLAALGTHGTHGTT
jgi:NTE family protein